MPRIIIEHRAIGAPVNDRGDGDLSVTTGISQMGTSVLSEFVGENCNASSEYASMLFFINPNTGLNTILHYQAGYTAFPEHNRYYDQRIVYELHTDEFEKIDFSYSTLISGLSLMRKFTSREFNASNEVHLTNSPQKTEFSSVEQTIADAIVAGLMLQRQVFIRLGQHDKLYGDEVRKSSKLKSLLNSINRIPRTIRRFVSLAYGVENNAPGFTRITPYLNVVVHFDEIINWNDAQNAIVLDWTDSNPQGIIPKYNEQLFDAVAPLVISFYGDNVRTFASLSNLIKIIPENTDRILHTRNSEIPSLPQGDKIILKKIYESGENVYQHKEVSRRLLWSSLSNNETDVNGILTLYPDLKNDKFFIDFIIQKIQYASSLDEIESLYLLNESNHDIREAAKIRILGSFDLIDECASNNNRRIAKDLHDNIKSYACNWSNENKIPRIDNSYFGLSIESLTITNWNDFEIVYNIISQNQNLKKKYLNRIPFNIEWNSAITESAYTKIKHRLSKSQENILRKQALDHYFDNDSLHFIFEEASLTLEEYELLLKKVEKDSVRYVTLYEKMANTASRKEIDIHYRRLYAKHLILEKKEDDAATLADKVGPDALDKQLFSSLAEECGKTNGLEFPNELLKSLVNFVESEEILQILYEIAIGNSKSVSLEDCARVAVQYGYKFYDTLKYDVSNALFPENIEKYNNLIAKLEQRGDATELVQCIEKRYTSLFDEKKPKSFESLLNLLSENGNDAIVNNLSDEFISGIVSSVNRGKLIEYAKYLDNCSSKYKSTIVSIRFCLADKYIDSEIVNSTNLPNYSYLGLLSNIDSQTITWFNIVANRLEKLTDLKLQSAANLFSRLLDCINAKENDFKPTNLQKKYIKRSIGSIAMALNREGQNELANNLVKKLPLSKLDVVFSELMAKKSFAIKVIDKWLWIVASVLFVIILFVISFIAIRGCNGNQTVTTPVNDTVKSVEPIQDSIYFRFYFCDSIPDSVQWIGVPLATAHPFSIVANAALDTLYHGKVTLSIEMRSTITDSLVHIMIPSDSIFFFSKLSAVLDYYKYIKNDTMTSSDKRFLTCVKKGKKDTLTVKFYREDLFDTIVANNVLTDCIVVAVDTFAINNSEFVKRNGRQHPLGRMEYFLWFSLQLDSITAINTLQ